MGSIKSDILFDVFFNSLFVKFLFYSFHGARSFILNILSQYDFKYPRTFRVYQHRAAAAAAASASSGASDWSHWNALWRLKIDPLPIFKHHNAFQWDQSDAPDDAAVAADADSAAAARCGYPFRHEPSGQPSDIIQPCSMVSCLSSLVASWSKDPFPTGCHDLWSFPFHLMITRATFIFQPLGRSSRTQDGTPSDNVTSFVPYLYVWAENCSKSRTSKIHSGSTRNGIPNEISRQKVTTNHWFNIKSLTKNFIKDQMKNAVNCVGRQGKV